MSTTSITITNARQPTTLEMPNATTGRYAVKRVLETLGLDTEQRGYVLMCIATGERIAEDDLICQWDGQALTLCWG